MRRAFAAFYGKENTLYYKTRGGGHNGSAEDMEEHVTRITTDGGVLQGDAPSGVYFNAGVQGMYDQLQDEYPEVTFVKYSDDLNGTVKPQYWVDVEEERAEAGKDENGNNRYQREDGTIPQRVPMPVAVMLRWEFLMETIGLRVSKTKRGVCSIDTELDAREYE